MNPRDNSEYKIIKPNDGDSEIKDYGNGITLEEECNASDHTTETWRKNGVIHRDNDLPAIIIRDYWSGYKQSEEWFVMGRPQRANNLPVVVKYDKDGNVIVSEEEQERQERIRVLEEELEQERLRVLEETTKIEEQIRVNEERIRVLEGRMKYCNT